MLAFGAHPDDLEVGAGGLIARLVAGGAQVTMVVASIPNRFEQRLAEAREGARRLGAALEIVRDQGQARVDSGPMHALVARFDRLVATHAPDLVVTHTAHDMHWDHHLVHRATISALRRTTCDVLAFNASPDLAALTRSAATCFADITATIETKLHAVAAHRSQFPDLEVLASRRDHARAAGRMCGVTHAEAFELLRLHV